MRSDVQKDITIRLGNSADDGGSPFNSLACYRADATGLFWGFVMGPMAAQSAIGFVPRRGMGSIGARVGLSKSE